MITVFTICSNNYLAQAKTLGDSLIKHNPQYNFVIFLVDRVAEDIDYSFFQPYEILPVEEISINEFDMMVSRYNITELNTAVKPFIFHYLFSRNHQVDAIIYLDPDIMIYAPFTELENHLHEYNIVLTPHFFTPIYDNYLIGEPGILNAGLYNLGFIAVKRSEESERFLKWWMIKLKDQCYIDFAKGLFVDQLWINFAPLYFEKVFIMRHLGYNVAYWNFHERTLGLDNQRYMVNNHYPLVFFHFSGYLFNEPETVSKYQTRYAFDQRSDIVPLFRDYHSRVMKNKFERFSQVPCYYVQLKARVEAQGQAENEIVVSESIYRHKGLVERCKQMLKNFFTWIRVNSQSTN